MGYTQFPALGCRAGGTSLSKTGSVSWPISSVLAMRIVWRCIGWKLHCNGVDLCGLGLCQFPRCLWDTCSLFEILTFDAVSMPFAGIQSHFHTHVLYWKLLGASEPASSNNFWPLEQGKSIGRVSGVGVFMEPGLYVVKWLWMNWLGAWPLLRCYRVFIGYLT